MTLHIVSGFLGSGKTTAITVAINKLLKRGLKCAVITNDQGTSLVDTSVMKKFKIPFAEVSGGCFCCRYDELEERIFHMRKSIEPEIIFAETVGSCTDLIATVLKPLIAYRSQDIGRITFSTLVDAELLTLYLEGNSLPFSDKTAYIWEKQIEESEILILNKIDLLPKKKLMILHETASKAFATKTLLFQNSLDPFSVNHWLELLDSTVRDEHHSLEIDYEKYGRGEANLAWLDEEIEIESDRNTALMTAHKLMDHLTNTIAMNGLPIGHLKYFLHYNNQSVKISYTTILNRNLFRISPPDYANKVQMMINARVQTSPEWLRAMVEETVQHISSEPGIAICEKNISSFSPAFPRPTHRFE